jgi:hypothetical protein
MYALQLELRLQDKTAQADELLRQSETLRSGERGEDPVVLEQYAWQGPYSQVIGWVPDPSAVQTGPIPVFQRNEKLQVKLRTGARWATSADLRKGPHGELRLRLRERFGATLVVLDYNRDGLPDLLLLGAVVQDGQVRDLLLRNEGHSRFTDVTTEAGLDGARPSVGCCVADFDNDGFFDLLITGVGEQRLYRNTGRAGFEDVTSRAGLDQLKTVCLGASFVDLDRDGDLDLVIAQYAATPEAALAMLGGAAEARGAGLAVYENLGESKPVEKPAPDKPAGLTVRFQRLKEPAALLGDAVPTVSLAVSDIDRDHDLDLVVLADRTPPQLVLNDRLMRFHRTALPAALAEPSNVPWNGALVLDSRHGNRAGTRYDGRSDLLLVGPNQPPALLLNHSHPAETDVTTWFEHGATNSPPLLQAQAIDLDRDGWTDVVGLSAEVPHKPVFLHNDGKRLVHLPGSLGADAAWPNDLLAVSAAPFQGDCLPHLMIWSETKGLELHESKDNGNSAQIVSLDGQRGPKEGRMRCNRDGLGSWVVAQVESLWTGTEYTTLSAGLGQSVGPLLLGIGPRPQADVVRIQWPDNTIQAEFGIAPCKLARIREADRRADSCPVLFAWNGQRYEFLTDCLGAGSVGEELPGGGHRYPRPEESIKIEGSQLVPLNGEYVIKMAEPMDEVTYLDRVELAVVDHPAGARVYPDERFVASGPPASQRLLAFREEVYPVQARDHRGRDVTQTLRAWDRSTVDGFARRAWLGLAEEHWVELDFGDRLKRFSSSDRLCLFLAGWTEYAYPETIYAAERAGVPMQVPVLERLGEHGRWQPVMEAGFPAGLPRMMTLDVTGKLGGDRCVLRLRTNMEIYWDQIFVAPLLDERALSITTLDAQSATLTVRGFLREVSPDGKPPVLYDYDQPLPVPESQMMGRVTRLGDVTSLLRAVDDRFVIVGPGDEVTVRFDARRLKEPTKGWQRSFVLRTWGYCKDSAPFTATGGAVGPLPFRAMHDYPYGPEVRYPHSDYEQEYNTRWIGPGQLSGAVHSGMASKR